MDRNFSLIPALFVSFRCTGRGHNAVCPEKLGNWQLTTGKHNPRRLFTGKLIASIFCLVDKILEQFCCNQSNRNVKHLICKAAFHQILRDVQAYFCKLAFPLNQNLQMENALQVDMLKCKVVQSGKLSEGCVNDYRLSEIV